MACTISGTVAYSYFVMPVTLAPSHPGATVAEMSDDDPGIMRAQRPPARPHRGHRPAADRRLRRLGARPPAGPRHVTVALVHGGFWREQYDRSPPTRSPRRWPATASTSPTSSTPASGCRAAAGRAPAPRVLARLESVHADTHLPDRVVVVGHSAGGHLALWLASGDHAPWVTGVVALAPAADLARGRPARPQQPRGPRAARRHPRRGTRRLGRRRPRPPAPHPPGGHRHRRARRRRAGRGRRLLRRLARRPTSRCAPPSPEAPTTSTSSTPRATPTSSCSPRSRSSPSPRTDRGVPSKVRRAASGPRHHPL